MGLLDRFRKTSNVQLPDSLHFECTPSTVLAACSGRGIAMANLPDPVFASGVMGVAYGIEPADDIIYAPINATISATTPTLHALGLRSDNGIELLLHLGVDTVTLRGEAFESFVVLDQQVQAGDPLMRIDREKIKAAGFSDTIITVVTNHYDFADVHVIDAGPVVRGQVILTIA